MQESVTKAAFGRLMSVSAARVSQWLKMGLPELKDGKIPVQSAMQWVAANVKLTKSRRGETKVKPEAKAPIPIARPAAEPAPRQERAESRPENSETLPEAQLRKERAIADLKEFEVRQKAGELVMAEDVRRAQTERAMVEREALLNWPGRIAGQMSAKLSIPERDLFILLDVEIRRFLQERSNVSLEQSAAVA